MRKTVIWITAIGVAHFALGTQTHAIHGLHIVLAGLFLVPILIATDAFAIVGGLLAAAAAGIVYMAHLLWSWHDSPMANADQFGMIGVYFVVALAAGRLVAVANWRKEQRDEVIRRSNAREAGERNLS
jgi:hypothetical protein